jgi:hypothetical protein
LREWRLKDREGWFSGVGFGGGGIITSRAAELGMHGHIVGGMGFSKRLTFDMGFKFYAPFEFKEEKGVIDYGIIGVNYFFYRDMLYIRGTGGMSVKFWQVKVKEDTFEVTKDYSKLGIFAGVGLGAEFIGSMGIGYGFSLNFRRAFYPEVRDVFLVAFAVELRFY